MNHYEMQFPKDHEWTQFITAVTREIGWCADYEEVE